MHTSYYFSIVKGEGCQVIEKWVFFKLLLQILTDSSVRITICNSFIGQKAILFSLFETAAQVFSIR